MVLLMEMIFKHLARTRLCSIERYIMIYIMILKLNQVLAYQMKVIGISRPSCGDLTLKHPQGPRPTICNHHGPPSSIFATQPIYHYDISAMPVATPSPQICTFRVY